MKQCLLLCAAVFALAQAVPASAQYMFLDVNGDGQCTSADVLSNLTTGIDVWLDTNHDKNGNPVTCPTGQPLSIGGSYFFILSSTGGVTYGTWADNLGFTTPGGGAQAGNDIWLARAALVTLPPGKYKLGTMPVTVTGTPVVSILSTDPGLDGTAISGFGSECTGVNFDNTMYLGDCGAVGITADFCDVCGTSSGTPVNKMTWGKIKEMYKGQ